MSPNFIPSPPTKLEIEKQIEFVNAVTRALLLNKEGAVEYAVQSFDSTTGILITSANGRALADLYAQGFDVRVHPQGTRVYPAKTKR